MAEQTALEARITALEDIEAIKKLKAKYWNCLDRKMWDEFSDCFSEDAVADYHHIERIEGKKAIMSYFRERSRQIRETVLRIHQGHNAEVNVTSHNKATGVWQLFGYAINPQTNKGRRSAGFYYDEFVKEKGEWKIISTKTTYFFMEEFDRTGMSLMDMQKKSS